MSPPVLVVLPDNEARVDLARPLLGVPPGLRLAGAARRAGFAEVILAPGTCAEVPGARALSTGDPVGAPALVAFEGAVIAEALLRSLGERPLAEEDGYSLGDAVGRPTAWLTGRLTCVPAEMPIAEELEWPEGHGPEDLARLVYAEDRPRAEAVIWAGEGEASASAPWGPLRRALLRRLADGGRPLGQIELAAVLGAVLSGAAALVFGRVGLALGAALLAGGVQVAEVLPALARLVAGRGGRADALWLAPAVRPLGHAALTAALTYTLVAESGRSSVAGLVLLALGAGAASLSLVHARAVLRGERPRFEIPGAAALAERLGTRLGPWLQSDVRIELVVFALALAGEPGPLWGALVAVALARLWRWFVAPQA